MSRLKNPLKMQEPTTFREITQQLFDQVIDGDSESIFQAIRDIPSKNIVFGTRSNMDILANCSVWSIDATFKVYFIMIL